MSPTAQEREIIPSLLAADPTRLAEEAARVAKVTRHLHVDVMDSRFVPSLTYGLPTVEALAAYIPQALDCHLQIHNPDQWAPHYAHAGAANVIFHLEAARNPLTTARAIRDAGARPGIAIAPQTPLSHIMCLLAEIDILLLMTVEPGAGGQPLHATALPRIRAARTLIDRTELPVRLHIDGGINPTTISACARAGADAFIAGTAIFAHHNPAAAVRTLRTLANNPKAWISDATKPLTRACPVCGTPIVAFRQGAGRPAIYCSAACRASAYRARKEWGL
ncbi:ribulose-phosphate 3-epimerase [Streptomyces sp. NPDC093595]|uniref:ribulose-phosphate 3-epimerase n=1 Tax=Streptomyces sp. NPDC093595 TaxID=3366045 RepID=UPI003829CD56